MTSVDRKPQRKIGFSAWIALGLLAGLASGIFLGDQIAWIKWLGDAFVGLLQMTILPYVAVSLVANIGRMSASSGLRLMRVSILVLLLLWGIGLLALLLMSQSFPAWSTGSFFSTRFIEQPPATNWLGLFIPSNPFRALADNAIPAVVVFSIGLGVALMNLPNKQRLLDPLDVISDALATLNKLVVRLTPVGMFAIVAYAAGTLDLARFSLIQGYLISYAVTALILSLVVLPLVVSAFTPWSWWTVLRASSDSLIAAFVIGNSFVVLPMIIDATKRLQRDQQSASSDQIQQPEYLVPMAYPFPDIGRIAGLVFIPFAAWFYGTTIDVETWPALMGVGLLGSFGKPVITIPLLLDIAELPGDIFNLFLASGVVAARFGDLLKTMHLLAFTILTMCWLSGTARVRPARLLGAALLSVALLAAAAMAIRGYLDAEFKDRYSREKLVTDRELVFPDDRNRSRVSMRILDASGPNPHPIRAGQTRVQRIKEYGAVRVGFDSDKVPFSYYSADHQLIGFDVEMAFYLADDLGVDLEFVPIAYDADLPGMKEMFAGLAPYDRVGMLNRQLSADCFDFAVSAQEGTVEQAASLPSIDPYMEVTLAIVVPDHEKHNFRTPERIAAIDNLKLGVIRGSFFAEKAPAAFADQPDVQIVELDSASEFFDGRYRDLDGLVINAESGSAWTFRNPGFTVANPLSGRVRVPLYLLTASNLEFEAFLRNWLRLKRADGTYRKLYDYWILGLEEEDRHPRWSVVRDVLHWVD